VEQEAAEAVRAAGLPHLVSCPFCGYSAELDPQFPTFACPAGRAGGCGVASCRACGRAAHPETRQCARVESAAGTSTRLAVEEVKRRAQAGENKKVRAARSTLAGRE
jgi:hypothetical protein